MASFFNQATLVYQGRRSNSNITESEIVDAVSVTKTAISENYAVGDAIAYSVSIVNSGNDVLTNVSLTDNLGAYVIGESTVYPLDYVSGSIKYYLNGILQPAPQVDVGAPLVISGLNVPVGANALIIYEARANEFAPLSQGSTITNSISLGANPLCSSLTDSATVPVREEANPFITKFASSAEISCGGEITYTFVLQNLGNTAVNATDNLTVEDVFNPILNITSVELNGAVLSEGTGYSYDTMTGEFSTLPGAITIPAASYESDAASGAVTANPGVSILTVSGTVS